MFNAPNILTRIPDIQRIYEINEKQEADLDAAVDQLEGNLFLDDMNAYQASRWEKILKISPLPDDTLDDRRFRVKTKVIERLPYSIRVLRQKIAQLSPEGYTIDINEDRTELSVGVSISSKKNIDSLTDMLDRMLPLNMTYSIDYIYNPWSVLANKNWGDIKDLTWERVGFDKNLREANE